MKSAVQYVLLPLFLVLGGCRLRSTQSPSELAASGTPATAASAPAAPMRCLAPEQALAVLRASADASGFPSASCVQRARELLSRMTLKEKLGQMLQVERGLVRDGEIVQFGFGSILSGGGSNPPRNTPLDWANMVTGFRQRSLESRLGIPLLYGVDAVHGHNNVRGAVIFPHNIGLGASRDPGLVERVGRATALEVAATGVDWTFSPVLAAARDERWGRTYESFGEAPELAELLGPALIRGLQGERLGARPDGVLACAKHYLGDGSTERGRDQGNASIARAELEASVLPAYRKAIAAGVGSIMVSFSSLDGVKMHCHGPLLNDTLKGELGFGGFLVSDWRGVEQLPGDALTQLASAVNAGVDMVMAPTVHTGFVAQLESLVPGRVAMERVDDAVARILAVKCALGKLDGKAFPRNAQGNLQPPTGIDSVGSAQHRALAREAVRQSLVLLDNHAALLPLKKSLRRIHLAGSHADDIGNQCGGWTIEWQGRKGPITEGTTLRQAFEGAVQRGTTLSYSLDGSGAEGADVAIAAIGERPYAEGSGDDAKLQLDPAGLEVVARLKAAGVPVVVVLMTGRPLLLGDLPQSADALLAAWLPGSEAQGITDVLFGDHDFSGKLPHSWPRSLEQVPINVGDAQYDPLYAYGYGLSYRAKR
jgi:beta-glucosidase